MFCKLDSMIELSDDGHEVDKMILTIDSILHTLFLITLEKWQAIRRKIKMFFKQSNKNDDNKHKSYFYFNRNIKKFIVSLKKNIKRM